MNRGALWGLLVICLGVAAFAPTAAAAKRGDFVIGPSRTMEAHFHGSKGFGFSLFGSGGYVSLTVTGHNALVQYTVEG